MTDLDVTEDDDEVELSFQELLQSSPCLCVVVGALSTCLVCAVIISMYIPAECSGNHGLYENKRKVLTERASQTASCNTFARNTDARQRNLRSRSCRRPHNLLHEEGKEKLQYEQINHHETLFDPEFGKQLTNNLPGISQLAYSMYLADLSRYAHDYEALTNELQANKPMSSNVTRQSRKRSLHQMLHDSESNEHCLSKIRLKKWSKARHSDMVCPLFVRSVGECEAIRTCGRNKIKLEQPMNGNLQLKVPGVKPSRPATSCKRVTHKRTGSTRRYSDRQDIQRQAAVNTGDGRNEYSWSQLSPVQHQQCGLSDISDTDTSHYFCAYVPQTFHQYKLAPNVSPRSSDTDVTTRSAISDTEVTTRPAKGESNLHSHKYMPGRRPPPGCLAQARTIKHCARLPERKQPVLHITEHLQRRLPYKHFKYIGTNLPVTHPQLSQFQKRRATSHSYDDRPSAIASSKFVLSSDGTNGQYFKYLHNNDHSLSSDSKSGRDTARDYLHSGWYQSSSCLLQNTLPNGRLWNAPDDAGLLFDRSTEGGSWENCAKICGRILEHRSNVFTPLASVLSCNDSSTRVVGSAASSGGQSQSSHFGDVTVDQGMSTPVHVKKQSMSASSGLTARHRTQRNGLSSLHQQVGHPVSYNSKTTQALLTRVSHRGKHEIRSSVDHETLISKRQRKHNCVSKNSPLVSADCLWKTEAVGSSEQFGNSANALLGTSPGDVDENTLSSIAGPWGKTHEASSKQRITFRQCSAAKESRQNVPTFTLHAVRSENGHTDRQSGNTNEHSNRDSKIKGKFTINPPLHKHIDNKIGVSLGNCSSELKSLMRTTIRDLQKYRLSASTGASNVPLSVEESTLESRGKDKQLVSKTRPRGRRFESQTGQDNSISRHPQDTYGCPDRSYQCKFSNSVEIPQGTSKLIHNPLTGTRTTISPRPIAQWRQGQQTREHLVDISEEDFSSQQSFVSRSLSWLCDCQGNSKKGAHACRRNGAHTCCTRLNSDTHTEARGFNKHGAALPPDRKKVSKGLAIIKNKLRDENITSTVRSCCDGDDQVDEHIVCVGVSEKCRHGVNIVQTSNQPEVRHRECQHSVGDRSDQLQPQCNLYREITQPVLCGCPVVDDDASPAGCTHHFSDASLITHLSAECAELTNQITFTSSHISHSIRIHKRDQDCTQKGNKTPPNTVSTNTHSTIDSLSIAHKYKIIQECPDSKHDDTTNGNGSKKQFECTLVLPADTSTLHCRGSDDVETYSVSREECPKTDVYDIVKSKTRSKMYDHPHKLGGVNRSIHDQNVSHEHTVKCDPPDSSCLSRHKTHQPDHPLGKERFHKKSKVTAGHKQHYKERHVGREHCPLIRKEGFKATKSHESEYTTWGNHHSGETTHDNVAKEKCHTHKERIHLTSKNRGLHGREHDPYSELPSRHSHRHTSSRTSIVSSSPRLVLKRGPNCDAQDSVSFQTSSSSSSMYVAQLITNTSSLDLSDNIYRQRDELVINTDSRCQHDYQLSSSTSTVCSSRPTKTDLQCCPIEYADNAHTYMAQEGTSARRMPGSMETFDNVTVSSLNDTLSVDTLQYHWPARIEHGATVNSWADTTTTLSNGSSVAGSGGSELPMYCQFITPSSLLTKAKHVPRNIHSQTETIVAHKSVHPQRGQYDLGMAEAHIREHSCETVQSLDNSSPEHSCETVQSPDNSSPEHSCETVQSPDNSSPEHSCETVQSPDNSSPEHSCETVQSPDNSSPEHSCETANSQDSSKSEHSCETVKSPDSSINEHSCGTAQSSENSSSQHRKPASKRSLQRSTSTRRQDSSTLSPPSILLDGESVSYMQIISKEGGFKGLLLSELDSLQFSSILKKSHSKNDDIKHGSCDKLLIAGRQPVSSPVSQTVCKHRPLKTRSRASGAPASAKSPWHGSQTRSQLTGRDNNKRVVFAQPLSQEEFVDQELVTEMRDNVHESRDCINSQVYNHVQNKISAPRGDTQAGVIIKRTHCTDFAKTPQCGNEVNEKQTRVNHFVSVKPVHKVAKSVKTVTSKTLTSQAHHPCHTKHSTLSLCSKNQDGKKTRKQTSKDHVLMKRQEVASISNKYHTVTTNTIRKETATNKSCENVENTERCTSSNEKDPSGTAPTEDLSCKPCSMSSRYLRTPHQYKGVSQHTFPNVTECLKTKHIQSRNNVQKHRNQKYSQNNNPKPKANNIGSYKADNSQISKNLARCPTNYMVEQIEPLNSKYQDLCRLVDVANFQTVLGNKGSEIYINNASSRVQTVSMFSAVKKANPRTVRSPRNVKKLGQKISPVYKKHMNQHVSTFTFSSTPKMSVFPKSKSCKLKAVMQCQKPEIARQSAENAALTYSHSEVDDVFTATQKSADAVAVASPPPCKRYRADLRQQGQNTQLHNTHKSQQSQKQETNKASKLQALISNMVIGQKSQSKFTPVNRISACCPPPRPQTTPRSRNIPKPVDQSTVATVSATDGSSSGLSRGPLYSKLQDNGDNTTQELRCQRKSSSNSLTKCRGPRTLIEMQRQDSTCSPAETPPRDLLGSNKIIRAYMKKHFTTKSAIPRRQVLFRGNRQDRNYKLPDINLSHQARVSFRPVRKPNILKAVLAAEDVVKKTPLSESSVADSFTSFGKSAHHSPMVRRAVARIKCDPAYSQSPIHNTNKEVQALRHNISQERYLKRYCPNMYDNSPHVHQQHRFERQNKAGVTPDCGNGQPYKSAATQQVQLRNNTHGAESTSNIHLTSKYAIISPKPGIDIRNCLRMGADSVENLEILQPDTDATAADITPCCLFIDCSNSPGLLLKTAKCDANRKLVGQIASLAFNKNIPNVDVTVEQRSRQHLHDADDVHEDANYAAYLLGHAQDSSPIPGRREMKLISTISGEVIQAPTPHSLDRIFSPDEQSSRVDESMPTRAPCDTTPDTDSHQHVVSSSPIEMAPFIHGALQEMAVNNSAKNIYWVSKHLGANNDFSTEDASMFPNTTDDVSASAIFDNNSSVADKACKHWTSRQKNDVVKPYKQYRNQTTYKLPHNQQQSHGNAIL